MHTSISYRQVNRLVRWALRDLKRQGRIQRTHKGRYYASPTPAEQQQAVIGCTPPVPGLPPSQRYGASRWGSQRRHLVSTIHRWDQYNQRRSQRLARTPDMTGPAPGAVPVRGPGPSPGPGLGLGPAPHPPGPEMPRVRPRLEPVPPPPPPRPLSAPALSALFGRVPHLFPGG